MDNWKSPGSIIGIAGIVIALAALYYAYKPDKEAAEAKDRKINQIKLQIKTVDSLIKNCHDRLESDRAVIWDLNGKMDDESKFSYQNAVQDQTERLKEFEDLTRQEADLKHQLDTR
jgi:hypothetical protein